MPTYSYACKDCDHQFDIQQAFTDPSLTQCPDCQGRLRKVYGTVGVVFKGSGFYRTDSRSSSAGAGAKGGEASSSAKEAAGNGASASGKESGSKESGGRESSGKESGGRESGGKKPAASGAPSSSTGPAKAARGG